MTVQSTHELPAAELAAAVAVNNAAGDITTVRLASGYGVVERCHGQSGLHPVTEGIADDPVE